MPVHEWFGPYKPADAPASWEFECQPRPDEDRTAKYEHYRKVLEDLVEREPENPRAWYYLADTLGILGYRGSAIKAWAKCAALPGWAEQAAWACYRASLVQFELGLTEYAIRTALSGIERAPHVAELYWLAGWLMYQIGDFAPAATMAEYAIKIGPQPRTGFCNPLAQKEYPEALLAHARAQLAGKPLAEPLKPAVRRA
jgi:tetratricopeptide (TPR) repeat protein